MAAIKNKIEDLHFLKYKATYSPKKQVNYLQMAFRLVKS